MEVFCIERPPYDEFLNNECLKIAFLLLKVPFLLLSCVDEVGVGRTCKKVVPGGCGR